MRLPIATAILQIAVLFLGSPTATAQVSLTGDARCLGVSPPANCGSLTAGNFSEGAVTVSGGSSFVSAFSTTLGANSGANGTITVQGQGSSFTGSTQNFGVGTVVGREGFGEINVLDGARLNTRGGVAGFTSGGVGRINLDGTDGLGNASFWENLAGNTIASDFRFGFLGNSIGELSINNGAMALSHTPVTFGSNGSGIIQGANSSFTVNESLTIVGANDRTFLVDESASLVARDLIVGTSFQGSQSGNLNVFNQSRIEAQTATINASARVGFDQSSKLNVTGTVSDIGQSGAFQLNNGSLLFDLAGTPTTDAMVNVFQDSAFFSGGTINVNVNSDFQAKPGDFHSLVSAASIGGIDATTPFDAWTFNSTTSRINTSIKTADGLSLNFDLPDIGSGNYLVPDLVDNDFDGVSDTLGLRVVDQAILLDWENPISKTIAAVAVPFSQEQYTAVLPAAAGPHEALEFQEGPVHAGLTKDQFQDQTAGEVRRLLASADFAVPVFSTSDDHILLNAPSAPFLVENKTLNVRFGKRIEGANDVFGKAFDVSFGIDVSPAGPLPFIGAGVIDQFNSRKDGEVAIFANIFSQDSVNFTASVAAHEIGHALGLRHIFPDVGGLAVMDDVRSDKVLGIEEFTRTPENIVEPPDKTGTEKDIRHNPTFHLRAYAGREDADDLKASNIEPGDWDQNSFRILSAAFEFDLFSGSDAIAEWLLLSTVSNESREFEEELTALGIVNSADFENSLAFQLQDSASYMFVGRGSLDSDFRYLLVFGEDDLSLLNPLSHSASSLLGKVMLFDTGNGDFMQVGTFVTELATIATISGIQGTTSTVPLPGALFLLFSAFLALGCVAKRKTK